MPVTGYCPGDLPLNKTNKTKTKTSTNPNPEILGQIGELNTFSEREEDVYSRGVRKQEGFRRIT